MLSPQEQSDMTNGPIPGESLTQDPSTPQDWESAPDYNSVETFMDDLFNNVTGEEQMDGILDPIRKGVAIEDVAQMLLFQAFSSGKINPDLVLGAVEPTIYMLLGLAEYAGIENTTLYPEDDMQDFDDEVAELEGATFEQLPTPKGISKGLLSKIKEVE